MAAAPIKNIAARSILSIAGHVRFFFLLQAGDTSLLFFLSFNFFFFPDIQVEWNEVVVKLGLGFSDAQSTKPKKSI